jgi:hypothetical protein
MLQKIQLAVKQRLVPFLVVFLFLLLSAGNSAMAQDVILKKDGNEIKAIVKEVGEETIKYNKFDNPSGPVYSIKKSEIFMITYKNGSKDVFKSEESSTEKNTERNTEKKEESSESEEKEPTEDPDKSRIEAVAINVYSQIINCCSGRKENARYEIYFDGIIKNKETGEIKIPIKVSWQGAFESQRWVKGVAISKKDSQLGWLYQADSGGLGMGCAKRCPVK